MRSLTHLERLEARSNHILLEVLAEAGNPVMLHMASKAFYPALPPFRSDPLATGTERQGRAVDKGQSARMQDKKQEGYF